MRPLLRYIAILALIPAICGYIGSTYVGIDGIGRALPRDAADRHHQGHHQLSVLVRDRLSDRACDRRDRAAIWRTRNFINALKLAAYSYTPIWLIGIVLLVPGLRVLTLLGLYALRLLWTGLPPLMGPPRNKVIHYAIAIAVIAFVIVFAARDHPGGDHGGAVRGEAFASRAKRCVTRFQGSALRYRIGRPAVRPCAAAMIAFASMP